VSSTPLFRNYLLYVAIKIDDLTFSQGHNGFLVARSAPGENTRLGVACLELAHDVHGIDALNVHAVLFFNSILDFNLVGATVNDKSILAFLVEGRNLLGYQWLLQDAHDCLFKMFSILLIALSTTITLSAFIRS